MWYCSGVDTCIGNLHNLHCHIHLCKGTEIETLKYKRMPIQHVFKFKEAVKKATHWPACLETINSNKLKNKGTFCVE